AAARHEDAVTSDLLVDALRESAKEESRSRRQLVLNESVATIGKLTTDELATLAVVFTLRYTKAQFVNSLLSLQAYLRRYIAPFVGELPQHDSAFQHLDYLRCGQLQVTQQQLGQIFRATYPGLFLRGLVPEEHPQLAEIPRDLLVSCLHD